MASSNFRPTIIIPTGKPSLKPALIVSAGWPVTSNGDVFGIPSYAFCKYSANNRFNKQYLMSGVIIQDPEDRCSNSDWSRNVPRKLRQLGSWGIYYKGGGEPVRRSRVNYMSTSSPGSSRFSIRRRLERRPWHTADHVTEISNEDGDLFKMAATAKRVRRSGYEMWLRLR